MGRIVVIGDIIYDSFTYATKIGVSAETPTIVAKPLERSSNLGGASLVAQHISLRNPDVTLITMCGESDDPWVEHYDIRAVAYPGWRISSKHRMFVDGYKMLQFDDINDRRHDQQSRMRFLSHFAKCIEDFRYDDVVVVSDNRHGTIDRDVAYAIVEWKKKLGFKLYVDSQYSQYSPNHDWYKGCDILFLNQREWKHYDVELERMEQEWGSNIVVKMGPSGCISSFGGKHIDIPGIKVDVVDTCGAGDAFLAAFVLSESEDNRVRLMEANAYAAWMCTKEGTRPPTREELIVEKDEWEVLS